MAVISHLHQTESCEYVEFGGTRIAPKSDSAKNTMSLLFRAIGPVQDVITRVLHGAEVPTAIASFYECTDKTIDGKDVKVGSPCLCRWMDSHCIF